MSDAICPGQKALFQNDGSNHYLRVVFLVYWQDAMPSAGVFYLHEHPFVLSIGGIADLQNDVMTVLKANTTGAAPLQAIYLGYEGVEMTPSDVTAAGWHVLSPFPAPTPEPVPTPTPSPMPSVEARSSSTGA